MEDWSSYQTDFSALNSAPMEQREFKEVPDGVYTCLINEMELGRSKSSGMPMVKVRFKIVGGEFDGQLMFANKLLLRSLDGSTNDGFLVRNCNKFLESFGVVASVQLTTLPQYAQTINTIAANAIGSNLMYAVNKTTKNNNGKSFTDYTIVDGPTPYAPTNQPEVEFYDPMSEAPQAAQPQQGGDDIPF